MHTHKYIYIRIYKSIELIEIFFPTNQCNHSSVAFDI